MLGRVRSVAPAPDRRKQDPLRECLTSGDEGGSQASGGFLLRVCPRRLHQSPGVVRSQGKSLNHDDDDCTGTAGRLRTTTLGPRSHGSNHSEIVSVYGWETDPRHASGCQSHRRFDQPHQDMSAQLRRGIDKQQIRSPGGICDGLLLRSLCNRTGNEPIPDQHHDDVPCLSTESILILGSTDLYKERSTAPPSRDVRRSVDWRWPGSAPTSAGTRSAGRLKGLLPDPDRRSGGKRIALVRRHSL